MRGVGVEIEFYMCVESIKRIGPTWKKKLQEIKRFFDSLNDALYREIRFDFLFTRLREQAYVNARFDFIRPVKVSNSPSFL